MNRHRTGQKLTGAIALAALVLCGLSGQARATASLGYGGQIFATGGNVIVDVLRSDSGYSNEIELFFSYPDLTNMYQIGIDNVSTTINLGAAGLSFDHGQELVFGIVNDNDDIFVMGRAGRNADGRIHATVSSSVIFGAGVIESWRVGFEDLWGGGDNDFNDAYIRVRQTVAVPEPASLLLLGIGLLGLAAVRRKRT